MIVVPLATRLRQAGIDVLDRSRITQRTWNQIFRDNLVRVGQLWVQEFLPKKFAPGARARYGFQPRSRAYEARKQRFADQRVAPVRVGSGIRIMPGIPFTPQPLVYTGAMREQVMGQQYTVRATATSRRQTVRIPIPLGHAVPAYVGAEIASVRRDELQKMHNLAFAGIVSELRQHGIEVVEAVA